MSEQDYRHIKVPGFGCTYGHEFEARTGDVYFLLKHLIKDESVSLQHEGPLLIFPLEAGSSSFRTKSATLSFDFRGYLATSGTGGSTLVADSPFLKVAVIGFSAAPVKRAVKTYELNATKAEKLFQKTRVLPRSVWINEICHRYIFERSVAQAPASTAADFLEAELIKEAYYGALAVSRTAERSSSAASGKPEPYFALMPRTMQLALSYIEEHLFEDFSLDELARQCAVSTPTLVRLFRKHTGIPPIRHLLSRRLTEAKILLATGRYSVTEVAEIVCYNDTSSFSHAYQKFFGTSPSREASGPAPKKT